MNDRALRRIVVGLGGPRDGVPREAGFDITAASEVMAILCLADSYDDLKRRLALIVVGRTAAGDPVTAKDLGAAGAMGALLQAAFEPNLVQTAEGTPAFVHGGPFANIAHGTSSIVSTKLAMHYADDVVVEAGFGFDLGGEKFLHLVCPGGGFWPSAIVLVATLGALAHHGGSKDVTDLDAVERGLAQVDHHVKGIRTFGLEPVVAINAFAQDREEHLAFVARHCASRGIAVARTTAYADGSVGSVELARRVTEVLDAPAGNTLAPQGLYVQEDSFREKLEKIAQRLYGARSVVLSPEAARDLDRFTAWGFGALPPCIAKTPLSVSDDASREGTPTGFDVTVDQVRLAAGAGFLVALSGGVQTMPGLPRDPAAKRIHVNSEGRIVGTMRDS
jgi:formate--tetrahydrofolate ligase